MNSAHAKAKYAAFRETVGLDFGVYRHQNDEGLPCGIMFYGTLRKGMPNYWLTTALLDLGHLSYKGKCYVKGGMILDMAGLPVMYRARNLLNAKATGEMYTCSFAALDILDAFEGNGIWYHKSNTPVFRTTKADDTKLRREDAHMAYVYYGPTVHWDEDGADALWYGGDNGHGFISDYVIFNEPRKFRELKPLRVDADHLLEFTTDDPVDIAGIRARILEIRAEAARVGMPVEAREDDDDEAIF